MLSFISGIFVGSVFAFCIYCLCAAARDDD